MKKVSVFVDNPIRSPYKNDQYDSFRGEGRNNINMGFGLALLGFEVNIIMIEWEVDNKQVFNNVYLSNKPKYSHYDYVLVWSINRMDSVSFDRAIFMDWNMMYVNDVHQYINRTGKNITYMCNNKFLIEYTQKHNQKFPIEVNYLPTLFPIPSINVGFIPYKFDNTNIETELKIYIYYNLSKTAEKYVHKEKLVTNFLRSKGYKIKLYIQTDSKSNCFEESDNITYLYDSEARYIDIINTISLVDICITVGTHCSGNNLPEIISLGRPTIYISDTIIDPNKDVYCNEIYKHPEYLLYIQESDEESKQKLEKFILNPKESYDKFKESYKDHDFDNWKEFAKKYLIS